MGFPLVLELAGDRKIPISVTCRVLGFSRQEFFVWLGNPVSSRDWDNAHLINAALAIHDDEPGFAYLLSRMSTEPDSARRWAKLSQSPAKTIPSCFVRTIAKM